MKSEMTRRLLVPVDFSAPSRTALLKALELARVFDLEVVLLTVVDTTGLAPISAGPSALEYGATAKRLLEEARVALDGVVREADPDRRWIKVVTVEEGRPAQVIVKHARALHPRTIVMGTRGRNGAEVVVGSVAERVVREAPCDVYLVHSAPFVERRPTDED